MWKKKQKNTVIFQNIDFIFYKANNNFSEISTKGYGNKEGPKINKKQSLLVCMTFLELRGIYPPT